jgi:hypothetical protein
VWTADTDDCAPRGLLCAHIGHSAALARFSKADATSARVFDHNGWKRVTRRAGQDHCRKKSANPERPITSGKSAFR